MIVRQLGNLTGAPVDGGSVTHQLRSVVTHLHLVHPPTLAVGSAVLAMLFMIAWRFPRSPGPLIAMILVGGCVALFDLASNGIHTVGAVQPALPVPTLTGIDIVSLLLTALGVALVAYSDNIVTARAFGARRREPVDSDQELFALGPQICPPPFFMAFPVSSRTPVTSAWTRTRPPSRSGAARPLLARSRPRVRPLS